MKNYSEEELKNILNLHKKWLDDDPAGKMANFQGANLQGANFQGANLQGANLRSANLQGANLRGANLQGANLQGANLQGAYLQGANLQYANLQGANLQDTNLQDACGLYQIVPEEGSFTVFKKLKEDIICKLLVPADAERVGGYTGRKCRASKSIVLEGNGISKFDNNFIYQVDKEVIPDSWNNDPRVECSNGIHFFLTRKEAEDY